MCQAKYFTSLTIFSLLLYIVASLTVYQEIQSLRSILQGRKQFEIQTEVSRVASLCNVIFSTKIFISILDLLSCSLTVTKETYENEETIVEYSRTSIS